MGARTGSGRPPMDALNQRIGHDDAENQRKLDAATLIMRNELVRTLSEPGKGRLYRVRKARFRILKSGKRSRLKDKPSDFHRASRPGDPPAPNTGNLRRSVFIEKIDDVQRRVGVAAPYGAWLNDGTKHIAPRPWVQIALNRALPQLRAIPGLSLELRRVRRGAR